VLQVQDVLYVFGGYNCGVDMAQAESCSVNMGAWEQLPPMHQRRSGSTAGKGRSSRIFVCGGNGISPVPLEAFDLSTRSWEVVQPPLLLDQSFSLTAIACGRLYICGGCDAKSQPSDNVVRLDLESGAWEVLPSMSRKRAYPMGYIGFS